MVYLPLLTVLLLVTTVASFSVPNPYECATCHSTFTSRNALFRHIRSEPVCAQAAGESKPLTKHSISLHFGYLSGHKQAGDALVASIRNATVLSATQCSVVKARPSCLNQETDCPAAQDILVVYFLAMEDYKLSDILPQTDPPGVALHGVHCVDTHSEMPLHAEHSCTQHTYHFLMPLSWLPNATAIADWYRISDSATKSCIPPDSLRHFKEILRSIESPFISAREARRFGALAHKERRPWHNFADPALQGEASPNTDPVWRVVDRARFEGFVQDTARNEIYLVCEFAGDEFLLQQVRRIMATAVCVVNGWLPADFFETSVRKELAIETPIAPPGHLYKAGSRFHAYELHFQGKTLFEVAEEKFTVNPNEWMQQQLLKDMKNTEEWLTQLRQVIAPRICAQLAESFRTHSLSGLSKIEHAPAEYKRVLDLLCELVETNQWPSTSVARANVIGNLEKEQSSQAGSFTVVSDFAFDFADGQLPLGNALFPELTSAVFDLEQCLARDMGGQRPTSSHCAVNCNAQFTPHVDSGRGMGQSLSMIVGLGNYVGGDLMLEGEANDIRYKPLQFDGWRLRHWTTPFSGQRFSLVWFTPEGMQRKENAVSTDSLSAVDSRGVVADV